MVYPSFFPFSNGNTFPRGFNPPPYGMTPMMRPPLPIPPTPTNFIGGPQTIPRAFNMGAPNFARGAAGNMASAANAANPLRNLANAGTNAASRLAGATEAAANVASGATAGGGFAKIEQYLNTADQLFSTAQKFTPMVKQISPMFQNLPALYRLYKGFQSIPNTNPTGNTANSVRNDGSDQRRPPSFRSRSAQTQQQPETGDQSFTPRARPSTPRIFQPPFDRG
jgi:hypothetical protein